MPHQMIPHGYHTATPHLVVGDVAVALRFYVEAFGAEELFRLPAPGGGTAHAEMRIGDSIVMLAEESDPWGNRSPATLGGTPVRIHLYLPDVDRFAERAVAAGAKVLIPIEDQFYGDRSGRLVDPFGHEWIVASRFEDLSPDQMRERFADFVRRSSGG